MDTPDLTDYWDERVGAIDSAAGRLSTLPDAEVQAALAAAAVLRGAPGVVTVFRNEAPEPGTDVEVWFPAT